MKKLAVLGLVLMMFSSVAYAGSLDGNSDFSGDGYHNVNFSGATVEVDYAGTNANVSTIVNKGNTVNEFYTQGDVIQGSFFGQYVNNGSEKGCEFINNSIVTDNDDTDGNDAVISNVLSTNKNKIINFMNVSGGTGAIATGNEYKKSEQASGIKVVSNVLDSTGQEVTAQLNQSQVFAGDNNFAVGAMNYSFGKIVVSNDDSYSKITVEGSGTAEYSYGNAFSKKGNYTMNFIRTDAASNNFTGHAELTAEGKGKSVWINGQLKENSDGSELIYGQKEYIVNGVDISFQSYLIDTRK